MHIVWTIFQIIAITHMLVVEIIDIQEILIQMHIKLRCKLCGIGKLMSGVCLFKCRNNYDLMRDRNSTNK